MSGFKFDDIPDQSGKTAIVTGANAGIGYAIAEALTRKGARVVLACRDEEKTDAARQKIVQATPGADIGYLKLDLADLDSVKNAAEAANKEKRIDYLINNAGVMTPPLSHTKDGSELQFGVNHLGHFALTCRLLPKLAKQGGGRVVSQSSLAHRGARIDFENLDASKGYSRTRFYGQSKLANILFAFELDRRLRAANSQVTSMACHPGIAQTELMRHLGPARIVLPLVGLFLNDADKGALPALQAATDPDAKGGDYYGPHGIREMSSSSSGKAFATKTARDPKLAQRLWEKSVELTGVDAGI